MNLDLAIVVKVLETPTGLAQARAAGISSDMLFDEGKKAWDFVEGFFREHGVQPALQTVEQSLGRKIEETALEILSYYAAEALKRWKLNVLAEGMRGTTEAVKRADPDAATKVLSEAVAKVMSRTGGADAMVDYTAEDVRRKRVDEYIRLKALGSGVDGLRTPWPTIDSATHGIHDDELWSVLGTKKSGKTFALTAFALGIWNHGENKLLFVSEEMGVWKLMRRVDALRSRLPYEDFLAGRLSTPAEDKWFAELKDLEGKAPFIVAGRAKAPTVAALESLVREVRPRCVCLDGAYFLDAASATKSKWERTSQVVDGIQAMVQRTRVPVVLTWQFNRAGGKQNQANAKNKAKGKDATAASSEDVAFAYELTMSSDVVLGFYRDDEMAQHDEAIVRIVDSREGRKVDPVRIRCDFKTMDFAEMGKEEAAASEAREREPGEDDDSPAPPGTQPLVF